MNQAKSSATAKGDKKSLFSAPNYRAYLSEYIGPAGTRSGLRTEIANTLKCHGSLVTLILQGKADLSLEQAEVLNAYFNHSDGEAQYFLDLVLLERAGSEMLKGRIRARLNARLKSMNKIKNRIAKNESISEEAKELFYSNSLHCVLHVLTSLPTMEGVSDFARALRLPEATVRNAIHFLESIGLVQKKGRKYSMSNQHIHLPNESPQILHHHRNLRELCTAGLSRRGGLDLHYSLCFSASEKDLSEIRNRMLELFQEMTKKIASSPEEKIAVFNLDLFDPLR